MLCLGLLGHAALAQSVEHLTRNEKVVSSILTGGSVFLLARSSVRSVVIRAPVCRAALITNHRTVAAQGSAVRRAGVECDGVGGYARVLETPVDHHVHH